jgi:uncharacterized protein
VALICDTGPIFAALDRSDIDHQVCARLFNTIDEQLIIPSPVVVEVDYLAGQHLQPDALLSLLADVVDGRLTIVDLTSDDYRRTIELLNRYRDPSLGFVDAAVLAIVERLKEPKLATLDRRHFSVVRPRHVPALRLLP